MQNQIDEQEISLLSQEKGAPSAAKYERHSAKKMNVASGEIIDIKRWLKGTYVDCERIIEYLSRERPQLELSDKLAQDFWCLYESILDCLNLYATPSSEYHVCSELCKMDKAAKESLRFSSQPKSKIIINWLDIKRSVCQHMIEKSASSNNQHSFFEAFTRFYTLLLEVMAAAYKHGREAPVDYVKSFSLYSQAAEMGSAYAINSLGCLYSDALGVENDDKKAFDLFQKSVSGGNKQAKINLATMYANGWGTEKDCSFAVDLYASALKKGHVKVIPFLIDLRENDDVKKKLRRKIYKIIRDCPSQGKPVVLHALAKMDLNRKPLLAKYKKRGMKYLKKAKAEGFEPAVDYYKKIKGELNEKNSLFKRQKNWVNKHSQPRGNRTYTKP